MLYDARIRDYMTTPLIAVDTTISIRAAQQLMEDQQIRHLPVVHDNKLVGILTSGDIRRAGPSTITTLSIWEIARLWEDVTVEQVMCRRVIRVHMDTPVTHAAQLMITYRFNSLPVVDERDFPVGIITEVDLFRLLIDAAKRERRLIPTPTEITPAELE